MKILIDADACPVVDETVKLAYKYSLECIIMCDTSHIIERAGCRTILCDKGSDSVDFRLVNLIEGSDIVITQDYGLAAMCMSKKARVINQNGLIYTDKNIETLLYTRFVNKKIRMAGKHTKGPSKRTKEQDEAFIKNLTLILEEAKNDRNIE